MGFIIDYVPGEPFRASKDVQKRLRELRGAGQYRRGFLINFTVRVLSAMGMNAAYCLVPGIDIVVNDEKTVCVRQSIIQPNRRRPSYDGRKLINGRGRNAAFHIAVHGQIPSVTHFVLYALDNSGAIEMTLVMPNPHTARVDLVIPQFKQYGGKYARYVDAWELLA